MFEGYRSRWARRFYRRAPAWGDEQNDSLGKSPLWWRFALFACTGLNPWRDRPGSITPRIGVPTTIRRRANMRHDSRQSMLLPGSPSRMKAPAIRRNRPARAAQIHLSLAFLKLW